MNKCEKHPKFKGNKKPAYQCPQCASLYLKLHGRRIPVAPPGKSHRSVKDYRRKEKHPVKYKDDDK